MSPSKYLALDIGADSGRAIVGTIKDNHLQLEEIHRFPNRQVRIHGRIYWDFLYLFDEIKKGLEKAATNGHKDVQSIGVDTWGVDFGLLDNTGQLVGNPVCYRDERTIGMMEIAFQKISKRDIYQHTGIQFIELNTLYQLLSMVEENNPQLQISDQFLFLPDLFNYLLTGRKVAEYSIASTSQLMDVNTKSWSKPVFDQLGLPLKLMPPVVETGTNLGPLLEEIAQEVDLDQLDVIATAGHDTACAVAAVPAQSGNWAYLSSGTWSLLGIECENPIVNGESFKIGFTNEGGVNGTIRFLRNIMGMWLLERCRVIWKKKGKSADYDDLLKQAMNSQPFKQIINPDHESFMNPPDMPKAIEKFCRNTDQPVPENQGEFVRCILESLAFKYHFILDKINSMFPNKIDVMHVVGGGSRNKMLNQFIANALGIRVIAGPVEATAIGNILIQAISKVRIKSLEEGRAMVANSFTLHKFEPEDHTTWENRYQNVTNLFE